MQACAGLFCKLVVVTISILHCTVHRLPASLSPPPATATALPAAARRVGPGAAGVDLPALVEGSLVQLYGIMGAPAVSVTPASEGTSAVLSLDKRCAPRAPCRDVSAPQVQRCIASHVEMT